MSDDLEVRRSKFRAAWNKIVSCDHIATNYGMACSFWRQNHPKYKSEMDKSMLELSSLCGVWCNVLFLFLFLFLIRINGEKGCWQYSIRCYANYPGQNPIRLIHDLTFDFLTSCKSGKLCSQFPECLSFLAPLQAWCQFAGLFCCFEMHSFLELVTSVSSVY